MRISVFLSVLVVVSLPGSSGAQTFASIGTRAEGMGGAFVAVADDASAIYWNPAGLATGVTFDLQASVADDSTVFVGAAVPVLGFSYYRTKQDTLLPTVSPPPDRQNGGSGEVRVRPLTTSNVGVTVVQTVVSGLVIGATTRLMWGGLEQFDPSTGSGSPRATSRGDSKTTADVDVGVMVSVAAVRVGLTARNLREPEFQAGPVAVKLERQVRVGAAFVPRSLPAGPNGPYSVAFDADLTTSPGPFGDQRGAAIGGEYWLARGRAGVRAGLRWSTVGTLNRGFSYGFSARLPHSLYAEGQLTNFEDVDENEWNIGLRVTF